jgi:hypothetical protein
LTLDTTALLARGPVVSTADSLVELGASCTFASGRIDSEGVLLSPGPHFFAGARLGEGNVARELQAVMNTSASSARLLLRDAVTAEQLDADYADEVVSIWEYGLGDTVELARVR